MSPLLARRNLRVFLIGFIVFILLLIPIFLLNSVDNNILDLIPFVAYTETEIQYDQEGNLISTTTIREIGNERALTDLNECVESQDRDVINPEMKEALETGKHTVTEKTWDCR